MRTGKYIAITLMMLLLSSATIAAQEWEASLYQQIETSILLPQLHESEVAITSCGAKPSASAVANQRAIQRAIDQCSKKGGGKVIIPAGQTFKTGAIEMKSGVNLVVEEDAVLEFVFEPALYPIVETSWEGLDCYNLSPCIYAFRAHDIAISGKGTIDGGGNKET